MWEGATLSGALTPKFYVALTGTSSLISGLILIFEWWYYRKHGTSFIEQLSLNYFSPWLGTAQPETQPPPHECKVWRNPMSLLRGAEYGRLWSVARRAALTYYDMNLSAQEHQAWFAAPAPAAPADRAMARAWREREPAARVAAARAALAARPECPAALLLLAEEDAPTVAAAERVLRRAARAAEAAWRARAAGGADARREAAVLAHVRRRAAVCARRLGRLRDAARAFRDLARDAPPALAAAPPSDNLLEVLLEQRLFAEAGALVARLEDTGAPPSATLLYTDALLRARAGAPQAEACVRRALRYNPHVAEYVLERRALTLPPEHFLARGDSEALAYAFFHLSHWRQSPQAIAMLERIYECVGPRASGACASCYDRELLPAHHVGAARGGPPALAVTLALLVAAAAALLRWPLMHLIYNQ